jgi:WhiB family transcriptional regulator, redox-sensing transcriptional regulator
VRLQQVERERVEWLMAPEASDPPSLLELLERPAWMRQAACRGMDVSMFVTERGQSTQPGKVICADCPVRAECEPYAVGAGQDLHGVWGGLTGETGGRCGGGARWRRGPG